MLCTVAVHSYRGPSVCIGLHCYTIYERSFNAIYFCNESLNFLLSVIEKEEEDIIRLILCPGFHTAV